jgi:hypothetical protein
MQASTGLDMDWSERVQSKYSFHITLSIRQLSLRLNRTVFR